MSDICICVTAYQKNYVIGELYYIVPETQAETKLSMRATTLTVNWNWTNFCMLM